MVDKKKIYSKNKEIFTEEMAKQCANQMLENDSCLQNLGITLLEVNLGRACMRMEVTENMLNGFKICHGGVIFTLADSTFAYSCNTYNRATVALGVSIDFMRPSFLNDILVATAIEKKRGITTGIYDIEVVNQEKKLVALFRGTAYITEKSILSKENNE